MKNLSRICLIIIAIVTLSYGLPSLYWQAFETKTNLPYFLYSSVQKDFFIRKIVNENNKYWDNHGNEITRKEYAEALPMVYYRELSSAGTLPDSVNGMAIDIHDLAKNQSHFMLRPNQISRPVYGLYPLFESQSGRVSLNMPKDYFRIGKRGMEFVDAASKKIMSEKSKQFTMTLKEEGFVFPATKIAGIPRTRKSRDDGYFVLDAAHHLFHIKMVKGDAEVHVVPIFRGMKIKHIACVDLKNKEFYCYLVTDDNQLYTVLFDSYELKHLPVDYFDANKHTLRVMGNLFYKHVIVTGDGFTSCFVFDRDYNFIDKKTERWTPKERTFSGRIASAIFPVTLTLKDVESSYRRFRFKFSPNLWFMVVNLVFTCLLFFFSRFENRKSNSADLLIVVLTGLYGFIATLIFSIRI